VRADGRGSLTRTRTALRAAAAEPGVRTEEVFCPSKRQEGRFFLAANMVYPSSGCALVGRLRSLVVGMPKGELLVAGDIEVLLIILEHAILIDAASPATLTGIPRPLIRKLPGAAVSKDPVPILFH
jgi:hypothetical protein